MIYEELCKELDNYPLNTLIRNGLTQNEIHQNIVNTFDKYFENKMNLERYSNDFLVHDWIGYNRNYYDKIDYNINEVIGIFRKAKIIDESKTFKTFAYFADETVDIGNKYWSMVILQNDLSKLGNHEFVAESFTTIENICEVCIKKFLVFIVCIHRITNHKDTSLDNLSKFKFGNLVNELLQANQLINLLNLTNSSVSISQWRNIACHKSYQYKCGKIECLYGKNLENLIVLQSKEELLDIVKNVIRIFQAMNFALNLYIYDNIQGIEAFFKDTSHNQECRDETWHLLFTTEMYTAGFKVISIDHIVDSLKISLQDITFQDKKKRAIQSSIAIYKAWLLTSTRNIEIIYIDVNGTPYLSSFATTAVCKEIADGRKDIYYLAEKTNFKTL